MILTYILTAYITGTLMTAILCAYYCGDDVDHLGAALVSLTWPIVVLAMAGELILHAAFWVGKKLRT